jgi:hypothetical protein
MGHPDFRVGGKIFATLGPAEAWGVVKLTPEQQAIVMHTEPRAFQPVNGAWGRRGCTQVRLEYAKAPSVRQALLTAWQNTAPKSLLKQADKESQATRPASKKTPSRRRLPRSRVVTLDTVRTIALALPEAVESTSYGTPAFKVRGRLFARLHQSGDAIVVQIDPKDRDARLRADPQTFYITDHYRNHAMMLVRLSTVLTDDLRELVQESWRRCAPPRLIAEHDRQ